MDIFVAFVACSSFPPLLKFFVENSLREIIFIKLKTGRHD